MVNIPRELLYEYIAYMKIYSCTSAILRIDEETAGKLESDIRNVFFPDDEYDKNPLAEMHPYSILLEEIRNQINDCIKRAGYKLDKPVLVGLFPTGNYFAQCKPYRSGTLILVDTATIEIIAGFIGLLLMNSEIGNDKGTLFYKELILETLDGPFYEYFMEKSSNHKLFVVDALTRILISYVKKSSDPKSFIKYKGDQRYFAPRIGMLSLVGPMRSQEEIPRIYYFHGWFDSCLRFIVAHEYAHIFLKQNQTLNRKPPLQLECEADRIAAKLLLESSEPPEEVNEQKFWFLNFISLMLIFVIKLAIDDVSHALTSKTTKGKLNDPQFTERWESMYSFMFEITDQYSLPEDVLDLPRAFWLWYSDRRNMVIENVNEQMYFETKIPSIVEVLSELNDQVLDETLRILINVEWFKDRYKMRKQYNTSKKVVKFKLI